MGKITRKMESKKAPVRVNHHYIEYIYSLLKGDQESYKCDTKDLISEDALSKTFSWERDHEKYLIKKIKINKIWKELELKNYLINESKKLIKANNENIVRFIDCCFNIRDENTYNVFLVTESIEGNCNLSNYIKDYHGKDFYNEQTYNVFGQLINGIYHIHKNSLFHGHLNTKNIKIIKEISKFNDSVKFTLKISDINFFIRPSVDITVIFK